MPLATRRPVLSRGKRRQNAHYVTHQIHTGYRHFIDFPLRCRTSPAFSAVVIRTALTQGRTDRLVLISFARGRQQCSTASDRNVDPDRNHNHVRET